MHKGKASFGFVALSVLFAACSSDDERSRSPVPDASIGSGGASAGGSAAGDGSSSGGTTSAPSKGGRSAASNGGSLTAGTSSSGGRATNSGGTTNAARSPTDSGIPADAAQDAGVPRPVCGPGLVVSPACSQCEMTQCPHDAAGCSESTGCRAHPACADYATAAEQAACSAVLDCARRTGCTGSGCYCGSLDYETCQMTNRFTPDGPCVKEIQAAFPANLTSSLIAFAVSNVRYPSGGALSLAQCATTTCILECVPYCRPPGAGGIGGFGGADAGTH